MILCETKQSWGCLSKTKVTQNDIQQRKALHKPNDDYTNLKKKLLYNWKSIYYYLFLNVWTLYSNIFFNKDGVSLQLTILWIKD